MRLNTLAGATFALLLSAPGASLAGNSVLSDIFDGSEDRLSPLPGTCAEPLDQLAYQDAGTFQVTESGDYVIRDVNQYNGLDVTALVYQGSFDPDNLVTPDGIDTVDTVNLTSGVEYRLVVQQWCENQEGAWAVAVSGPGEISAALERAVPAMTMGAFTDDDPRATTECSEGGQYHTTDAFQVEVTGTYYFTDVLWDQSFDICMMVYTQPFNPDDPARGLVPANFGKTFLDDFDNIDLVAGQDYYVVVQPRFVATEGDYFFVLAPPAPFRINKALAGGWYNGDVIGQGFLLDVYENIDYMFLAWFTFDSARPDASVPSSIGEAGQRWLTAQGGYTGNTADLGLFNAKDMVFNSGSPVVDNQPDGSMTVTFDSCTEGTIQYDIQSAEETGTIPIVPLVDPTLDSSSLELCESFTRQPGMPGPL